MSDKSTPVAASGAPTPPDTRCTVCHADYPETGQRAGTPWMTWGPGFHICRWCVQAGRDARRHRERAAPGAAAPLADFKALASAMRKLLPPKLFAEVRGYLDPLGTFIDVLHDSAGSPLALEALDLRPAQVLARELRREAEIRCGTFARAEAVEDLIAEIRRLRAGRHA